MLKNSDTCNRFHLKISVGLTLPLFKFRRIKLYFLLNINFRTGTYIHTHTQTLTRTHIYIHTHPYIHTTYVHTFSNTPQTAPVPLNSSILHYCSCIVVSPQSAPVSQQAIIPTVPHPNQHTAFTAKLS